MHHRIVRESFASFLADFVLPTPTDIIAGLCTAKPGVAINLSIVDEMHADPTESILEAFRRR